MKYQNPKLRQMLAAAYVLGTLRGAARRRFERLLQKDAALAKELRGWERRLSPLQRSFAPVAPREIVWAGIEQRINAARTVALPRARSVLEDRGPLRFWRGWAVAASLATVVLGYGLWLQLRQPPQVIEQVRTVQVLQPMPYVALLQPNAPAQWIVLVAPARRSLKVSASGAYPIDLNTQSLQIWVLDDAGQPHPMGLMPDGNTSVELPLPDMKMPQKPVIAVSVEPKGGSPTGLPTGPVVTTAPLLQL
jgi:anti-sigma-K factor RskA